MNLKTLAIAWTLMWGLSYIFVAFVAPNIAIDTPAFFYLILGAIMILSTWLRYFTTNPLGRTLIRGLLLILGALEVYGGIASFSGVGLWNVPFANIEIFQVSMAFADLISAVFLFVLAIDKWNP